MKYTATSPRVPAIEDWYDFEEEEDKFYNALDTIMPDADKIDKDEATITEYEDDWLTDEIWEEVGKLEKLAKQLDEVVKPTIKQNRSKWNWKCNKLKSLGWNWSRWDWSRPNNPQMS